MKEQTKVVSFRVPVAEHARLTREASLQEDSKSVPDYARTIVMARHEKETDEGSLAMEVACLKDEIRELREDLSVAIKALLITKGSQSIVTAEQADQWVKQNLKHVA